MIKITLQQLQKMGACIEGQDWFVKSKLTSLKSIISALLKDIHADYARWLLSRLLTQSQCVQWAIYSATLALPAFEKIFPDDKRPRKAIQAAKNFLAGKISRSAARSAASAASAANAAWSAASTESAASAANAAWSAASTESAASAASAAWSAESAARSVASAAWSAESAARNKKIMAFALKLLGEIK